MVRGQIAARYPQAQIQRVDPEDDPLRMTEDEQAWSMTLRADGPEYVPLRTFRDDDLLDPGSDPLIALMGALSNINEGERIVARLMLRSMGPDWSEAHLEKAHKRPVPDRYEPSYTYQTRPLQMDGVTMAVLGVAALVALQGYLVGAGRGDLEGGAPGSRPRPRPGRREAGHGTGGRRSRSGSSTPCSSRRRSPASPSTRRYR